MSFSPAWLDLREPADQAARDPALLALAMQIALQGEGRVLDLGAGTGSMARAFSSADVRWTLIDADDTLLAVAKRRVVGDIQCLRHDLAQIDTLDLAGASLVTASALFDLVSARWIDALAVRLAAARLPVYATLNYDGFMRWSPQIASDADVTAAFNRHQQTDKGFGPALGPDGGAYLGEALRALGYRVQIAHSPWRLDEGYAALQAELLNGIAEAAGDAGFARHRAWLDARLEAISSGECTIGHIDLLATI